MKNISLPESVVLDIGKCYSSPSDCAITLKPSLLCLLLPNIVLYYIYFHPVFSMPILSCVVKKDIIVWRFILNFYNLFSHRPLSFQIDISRCQLQMAHAVCVICGNWLFLNYHLCFFFRILILYVGLYSPWS